MSGIDRSPTVPSQILSLLMTTVAVVTTLAGTPSSVGVALLGASSLVVGVLIGSRLALDAGTGLLFIAVIVAAAVTTRPTIPLLGAVATVVAWDVGDTGIDLGKQLGGNAQTRRLEVIHASASTAVGLSAAAGCYAVFLLAKENQPLPALVLLLFAAVVLTATLRD